MPQVEVGHARLDVRTYYEAWCEEHQWIGERHDHESEAWLEWNRHGREHHTGMVRPQKYKRIVTYEPVDDEPEQESEMETGETADASR